MIIGEDVVTVGTDSLASAIVRTRGAIQGGQMRQSLQHGSRFKAVTARMTILAESIGIQR